MRVEYGGLKGGRVEEIDQTLTVPRLYLYSGILTEQLFKTRKSFRQGCIPKYAPVEAIQILLEQA